VRGEEVEGDENGIWRWDRQASVIREFPGLGRSGI